MRTRIGLDSLSSVVGHSLELAVLEINAHRVYVSEKMVAASLNGLI